MAKDPFSLLDKIHDLDVGCLECLVPVLISLENEVVVMAAGSVRGKMRVVGRCGVRHGPEM
jgi:hypothetical protein